MVTTAAAMREWNIGGATPDWCSSLSDTSTYWTPLKENIAELFDRTGLLFLLETGPSAGTNREPPPCLKRHIKNAAHNIEAAAEFSWLRGCTVIWNPRIWVVNVPAAPAKLEPRLMSYVPETKHE